jgi:hypothetical protein
MTVFFETPSTSPSYLRKIINDELSTYRSITIVDIGDSASTSFWYDRWLDSDTLATSHSALFFHTIRPNVSVQQVFSGRV